MSVCICPDGVGDEPGIPPAYLATLRQSCTAHEVPCLACKRRPAARLSTGEPRLLCVECAEAAAKDEARRD